MFLDIGIREGSMTLMLKHYKANFDRYIGKELLFFMKLQFQECFGKFSEGFKSSWSSISF